MADNNTPTAPTFQFNQVYLKDASFESPCSPEVFGPQNPNRNPAIDVQLKIQHQRVADTENIYEVVLAITCTAKSDEDTLFIAEVQQAGIFTLAGYEAAPLEKILEAACPNVLFPFAREAISQLVAKGGFPQLLLAPVNFEMMYEQKKSSPQPDAEGAPNSA